MEKPLRAHSIVYCSISPEIMVVCWGYWGRGFEGVIGKKIFMSYYVNLINLYFYLLNADFIKCVTNVSFFSENYTIIEII